MWNDFYTKEDDFYECDHCNFKVNGKQIKLNFTLIFQSKSTDQRMILMHYGMCKVLTTQTDRKSLKITIQTTPTTYKWIGEQVM